MRYANIMDHWIWSRARALVRAGAPSSRPANEVAAGRVIEKGLTAQQSAVATTRWRAPVAADLLVEKREAA